MIEQDRFAFNKSLYFFGMLSLMGCLILLVFSLYYLPYLVWSYEYEVMAFVTDWKYHLVHTHDLSDRVAGLLVFLGMFVPGLMLGVIADVISNHIDKSLLKPDLAPEEESVETAKNNSQEGLFQSINIFLKIVIIIILAVSVLFFLEWLITSSGPPA